MKSSKYIDFQFPVPFGYSVEEMKSPFVLEYSPMFEKLDLSMINEFNSKRGATGYSRHALIRACIVYANEGYRSIIQLIKELKSKPYFTKYIIGFKDSVPDDSCFYRFINSLDPEIVRQLIAQVNLNYYKSNLPSLIAIDSKPIKANTKHNNPKAFKKNLSDKTQKPKRNKDATLCYFSKSNDENNGKKTTFFFWGYRVHLIVDAENDNPLTYMLEPNNKTDDNVALELYRKLVEFYPDLYQSGLRQLADKGYYVQKVFDSFDFWFDGESLIPKKRKSNESHEIPKCEADHKMKYHSNWFEKEQQRFRVKFTCPLDQKCDKAKSKSGCYKYLQVRKPFAGEINQNSATFKKLYPKRQSVERVNAFLQTRRWENPKNFFIRGIENLIGFALLAKSLSI